MARHGGRNLGLSRVAAALRRPVLPPFRHPARVRPRNRLGEWLAEHPHGSLRQHLLLHALLSLEVHSRRAPHLGRQYRPRPNLESGPRQSGAGPDQDWYLALRLALLDPPGRFGATFRVLDLSVNRLSAGPAPR